MFVNLHNHTEYSALDGQPSAKNLLDRVLSLGQKAIAITDHGTMSGTYEFKKVMMKGGVKPIIGAEIYLTLKPNEKVRDNHHLLLLAKNNQGVKELYQILTLAQDLYYYKPRNTIEQILGYGKNGNLITTTGCLGSPFHHYLKEGDISSYNDLMSQFYDSFGSNFYLELQEHNIPELTANNKVLLESGLPSIITADAHYARKEDSGLHQLMLCIQTGSKLDAPSLSFGDDSFYIMSDEDVINQFSSYDEGLVKSAIENTTIIADSVTNELSPKKYHIPKFDKTVNADDLLKEIINKKITNRYQTISDTITERVNTEIEIISNMGFSDYFLIINDLCEHMSQNNILYNVRGSGAGSIVAYILGITSVNPLRYGLLFSRFLNKNRVSMPDIDIDIPDDSREAAFNYLASKYGYDNVAQILAISYLGKKAAVKDTARVLGMDYAKANLLSSNFDDIELEEYVPKDDEEKNVMAYALQLKDKVRQTTTHAAGCVITPLPITEYGHFVKPKKKMGLLKGVIGMDMKVVDEEGLLKVDLLGLLTLTVVRECLQLIKQRHGKVYNIETIPYDNHLVSPYNEPVSPALELFSKGNLAGVFQSESSGMRQVLKDMSPETMEHVIASISLYRPGPMAFIPSYVARRHGKEQISYLHPDLKESLENTYGIIVYQEQIIQIVQKFAGFSEAEADNVRKAISKKDETVMKKEGEHFIKNGISNGYNSDILKSIWDMIITFASYGFNKSHATDYAKLAIQTAWLKAMYPIEWYSALLTGNRNNQDKLASLIIEARNDGISILPPDIKYVGGFRIIDETTLSFPLEAIKYVPKIKELIVKGLDQLTAKPLEINTRQFKALSGAGAFDTLKVKGLNDVYQKRQWLINNSALAINYSKTPKLFNFTDLLLPEDLVVTSVDKNEFLEMEKELLGVYISGHPTDGLLDKASILGVNANDITEEEITLVVLIQDIKRIKTKTGKDMCFAIGNTATNNYNLVFFPNIYSDSIQNNIPMALSVRKDKESYIVNKILDWTYVSLPDFPPILTTKELDKLESYLQSIGY